MDDVWMIRGADVRWIVTHQGCKRELLILLLKED